MQNKSFIFWLFNKDKKALYFDKIVRQTDLYKPNGQPAHLEYSPDGWKDSLVKYGRNFKYLGVFRDFTAPMNFKKDGAKILKDAMWKLGMEAIVYLAISKLNRTVYPPKYEPWYVGELDFSKFNQKKSNIVLNVMEGGMSKYLKAFESTTYEIPVDADPQAKIVVMDGMPFTNTITYSIFNNTEAILANQRQLVAMGTIAEEGSTQGVLNQDQSIGDSPDTNGFMTDESKYITVAITGHIDINVLNPDHNIKIWIRKTNTVSTDYVDYSVADETPPTGAKTYEFDFSIDLEPNDFLAFQYNSVGSVGSQIFKITGGELIVKYDVTFQQTFVKGLTPERVLQKLVEKMTEGRYTASSNYLAGMDDLLITSGSAIRNHEGQTHEVGGSVIKTSLEDFFQSLNIRGIGLGIENDVLIIENKKYFFKDDVVMELGEVSELEVVVADDLVFNTIKVGYPNQDYDAVNGKDEPNVTQNYTTPHTRIVKELDLVSPFRSDPTGIELLRINLDGKNTTDNSSDNDTFFLNVKKGGTYVYYSGNVSYNENGANTITIPQEFLGNSGSITINGTLNSGAFTVTNISYLMVGFTIITVAETLADGTENAVINATSDTLYMLNRPAFTSLTGLLHPDKMFNVLLSPKTNLINNEDWIHSVLDFQDQSFVKFQSSDKNSDMSYTLNGKTVTEKTDIQIGSMPKKLFRPYYFNFKVPTDFNFLKTIAASPYSKLGFTYNGEKYYGYLVDGGSLPATRDVQQIKLLCAPETNLSQLIDMP